VAKFKRDDVVRFADGNGKMLLWGDRVDIDWMTVTGYDEEGRVTTASHPYTFAFPEEALVKVGELYDMKYDEDPSSPNYGNEVYVWLTELNEPEEQPDED
jgi:hypothetical protein